MTAEARPCAISLLTCLFSHLTPAAKPPFIGPSMHLKGRFKWQIVNEYQNKYLQIINRLKKIKYTVEIAAQL